MTKMIGGNKIKGAKLNDREERPQKVKKFDRPPATVANLQNNTLKD